MGRASRHVRPCIQISHIPRGRKKKKGKAEKERSTGQRGALSPLLNSRVARSKSKARGDLSLSPKGRADLEANLIH